MKYVIWSTTFKRYYHEHNNGFSHYHNIEKASYYSSREEALQASMRRPDPSSMIVYSIDEAIVAEIMRK